MTFKHFTSGLIIIMFFGCASFSKKEFRNVNEALDSKNVDKLNGSYSFYPTKRFGTIFENVPADSLKYANSYQGIINEDWESRKKLDSSLKSNSFYSIKLNLVNENKLRVSLLENGNVLRDTIFNGRVKNKMFFIENTFLSCTGIPYLFGKCENNKRRIGLTKFNNLIINEAVCNEGAILIILGGGHRYNASFEYERIK